MTHKAKRDIHAARKAVQQERTKAKSRSPKSDLSLVRHQCGHTVAHNLKRFSPTERGTIRQRLSQESCQPCLQREHQAAVAAFEADLPALTGAPGDVSAARQTRFLLLPQIRAAAASEIRLHHSTWHQRQISTAERDLLITWVEQAERWLAQQSKATFWLVAAPKYAPQLLLKMFIRRIATKATKG